MPDLSNRVAYLYAYQIRDEGTHSTDSHKY